MSVKEANGPWCRYSGADTSKAFADKYQRRKKVAEALDVLPEPLRKRASDSLARLEAAEALDLYLDKAASELPVVKRAGVRSLQYRVASGVPLVQAVKEAYAYDDARAEVLARAVCKAAAAYKEALVTFNEGSKDPGEAARFSKMGFRTQTHETFHGKPAEGNAVLGRDR